MANNIYKFEAETEKLLELLTNSIYSNKDIFLRELISNASDAIDKARIKSITKLDFLGDDTDLQIKIDVNKDEKTITISDNGIGMTKDELVSNIGTIAKSGTKEFIDKLEKAKQENNLIGKFGVGFYSVFMVADKVEVDSKSSSNKTANKWISDGKGTFEMISSDKKTRGTEIKIFLKESESEYLDEWKLKSLVKNYSNYVQVPIMMLESETEENKGKRKYEQINESKPIWEKSKSEITEKEYNDFYASISYDYEKPLTNIHINSEGIVNFKSILYIPKKKNIFYNNDDASKDYGPKLFVQNVLILENTKDLLPVWLRFVHGIVSTNDLPLNISREILQSNTILDKIKKNLVKKILDKLETELKENPDYDEFLANFSAYLKEGVYYESDNREKIASLIKFKSLLIGKNITFNEYIENAKSDKKEIYYVIGKNENEALGNPYIDQFKENNIDVLLFTDPIDEWLIQVLTEFNTYKLVSITNAEIKGKNEEETKENEKIQEEKKSILEFIKNTIGRDKIENVRITDKLGTNLCALNTKEGGITPQMEKMMKAMGQAVPLNKKNLEINSEHKIFKIIEKEFEVDPKSEKLKDLILYVYEQGILLEGGELSNYKEFINRVNNFIS